MYGLRSCTRAYHLPNFPTGLAFIISRNPRLRTGVVVAPAAAAAVAAGVVFGSWGRVEAFEWCECGGFVGGVFLSAGVFPVEWLELCRRCGRVRRNTWGWDLGVIGRRRVEVEGEVEALVKRPFRRRVMSKTTSSYLQRIVESRSKKKKIVRIGKQ